MFSRTLTCFFVGIVTATSSWAELPSYDLVVYGATSAGIVAAVQARKMGRSVVVVGPDTHLGGLSSSGLGFTDTGNKAVIGGLARDFYHRIWNEYQRAETWKWQKQSEYGNKGQGTPAMDGTQRTMWIFEPHVAEKVFEDYVREFEIPVVRNEWLERKNGVAKEGGRIREITMLSGKKFAGKMFVDASYEGDLMASAGVSYHVGREANSVYGEEHNGVQVGVLHHRHHFGVLNTPLSAYKVPGDPRSGLLPRVSPIPPGVRGEGDKRVQAYCYRFCVTTVPENMEPFPKPADYDPDQYELFLRVLNTGWTEFFKKFDPIPNHKTDTNNHGPFSFDNIGENYDYPEASYERRREILAKHRSYQQGLLYFVSNDARVPAEVREKARTYGLPKDEFMDNGHWPHQIYVREARRMVGSFIMTENELRKRKPTPDSVGMGSYTIDSHNVQRYVTPERHVQNEGDIGVPITPYAIAYGALVPKRGEVENLFAPTCVSSSHIAFGSIRMEPVFMILGQSAATAAVLAIESNLKVQDVPYAALKARLEADGQVLEYEVPAGQKGDSDHGGIPAASLKGVVVDDEQAEFAGDWASGSAGPSVGSGYRHDRNVRDGRSTAVFRATLPAAGRYEVRLAYAQNANRSTRVLVRVAHVGGEAEKVINQREKPSIEELFVPLGEFAFSPDKPAVVTISNEGANGYVIADAVQWVPLP